MRLPAGLDVYIRRAHDEKRYEEYDRPGDPRPTEKYIEAQNGTEFEVVVRVLPTFKYYAAASMNIDVKMDDGTLIDESRRWDTEAAKKSPVMVISTFSYKSDGQWFNGKFNFAAFALDEDMAIESDEVRKQVASLGRIVITIQRGRYKQRPLRMEYEENQVRSEMNDKKIIKDHGISHFIAPGEPVPLSACPYTSLKFVKSKGKPGESIQCTFYYRSRFSLERLGIVPASPIDDPTEESIPKREATRTGNVTEATESSEDGSRRGVAQTPVPCEGGLNGTAQSSEPKHDEPAQTGTSGHGMKQIKRERDESVQDGLSEIPAAKRAKFVDLTEVDEPKPQVIQKPEVKTQTTIKAADVKPEMGQDNSIMSMKDIPALDITVISDDEAEIPKIKTEAKEVPTIKKEAQKVHESATRPRAGNELGDTGMDNEEDLEIELRKLDIQLRLNRLRRSKH